MLVFCDGSAATGALGGVAAAGNDGTTGGVEMLLLGGCGAGAARAATVGVVGALIAAVSWLTGAALAARGAGGLR